MKNKKQVSPRRTKKEAQNAKKTLTIKTGIKAGPGIIIHP